MEIVQQHRTQGGLLTYARHDSAATGTPMKTSAKSTGNIRAGA